MTGERSTSPTDYASYVDATIRPQDDLFGHVNGRWLAETPIPDDRSRIGAFIDLRDLSEERVRGIITELGETTPDGDDAESVAARKIGTLYAAYMDTAAIEEAGAAPLQADLRPIAEAADRASLAQVMGELQRAGVGGLVGIDVSPGISTPDYLVWFAQDGIGLPDEAYYRQDEFGPVREAYEGHVARLLTLAGVVEGDAATDAASSSRPGSPPTTGTTCGCARPSRSTTR
jgi:putative endopeptidase